MEKMNYQKGFVWKRIVWLIVAVIILGFLMYKAKEKVHTVIVNDQMIAENHLLDLTLKSINPKSGLPGDVIEISGYNFGDKPFVIFGNYCQKCDGYQIIKPTSSTNSNLKFVVPGIATGKNSTMEVRIRNSGGLVTDPISFVMNPTTQNQTADWKTYTSSKYGIIFSYPKDWTVKESINVEVDQIQLLSPETALFVKNNPNASALDGISYDMYIGIHGYKQVAYNTQGVEKVNFGGIDGIKYITQGDRTSEGFIVDKQPYTYVISAFLPETEVKTKIFSSFKFTP
jgi:hypothetical protein